MDSAFIYRAANELVQNAGTRNIKQIARSCSLDISETSRIKDMLGLLSLYFDKPLIFPRQQARVPPYSVSAPPASAVFGLSVERNQKPFPMLQRLVAPTSPCRTEVEVKRSIRANPHEIEIFSG